MEPETSIYTILVIIKKKNLVKVKTSCSLSHTPKELLCCRDTIPIIIDDSDVAIKMD